MVVFARSLEFLKSQGAIWRETKPGAFELWVEYSRLRDLNGQANGKIEAALREWHKGLHEKHPAKKLSRWLHVDEFGPWRDRDISWIGGGGPRYNVIHPKTKKPCKVPDRGWGFATPESMQRQIDLGLVEFREDHTKPPFLKRHLRPHVEELREDEEGEEEGMDGDEDIALQVMPSVIYKQSQTAVRYLRGLLGENVFENPKDYLVLSRLFNYCTGPDDLILDSFAGSGSAGQATLESNKRDNGHRRFILIQQTFDSKGDAEADRNICRTVTQPRLCKSAKQERYDLNFTYARLGPKLFGEYRDFGDQPPAYEELAKYVFYTETSHEFDRKALDSKTGRIGEHAGTAYYLLYAPSAKEDRALDLEWLKKVGAKEKCKKLVDYCEKLWAHRDELTVWEKQASKSLRTMLVPVNLK
jgi:adenine-specific DNA-methyltransferase